MAWQYEVAKEQALEGFKNTLAPARRRLVNYCINGLGRLEGMRYEGVILIQSPDPTEGSVFQYNNGQYLRIDASRTDGSRPIWPRATTRRKIERVLELYAEPEYFLHEGIVDIARNIKEAQSKQSEIVSVESRPPSG